MVRSISANAQAKLDQNIGTEPVVIIEIQWIDGGSIYTYADKDLGAGEGKILEIGGLDNTIVIQGVQSGTTGDSQAVSVTIDDIDGTIKDIMDSHDIHKEPAWVYQSFQGIDASDKFLIFKGQISSPLQWNEGDRTVTFDILTRLEDAEVGFSTEEGKFPTSPEELLGQPWPLVFGTVKLCPALKTRTPRKGLLKTGFGIRDYMLAPKAEQVDRICCPVHFAGFSISGSSVLGYKVLPTYKVDVACDCTKRANICKLNVKLAEQITHEFNTIEILDGNFPQGIEVVLEIKGAHLTGSFAGTESNPSTTFNITKRVHPKTVLGDPIIPEIKDFSCIQVFDPFFGATDITAQLEAQSAGVERCILDEVCTEFEDNFRGYYNRVGGPQEKNSGDYLAQFEEAGFYWAEPGAEVTLVGDDEIVYIVNLLPATVHHVKAWRTFTTSGLRQLTSVPRDKYTVRQSDFNGYTVTELVFDKPLSSLGEGWEDDIFVTQTSTVGPNTVDIMEFLINKYTSFSFDATFADVKTKIDNYPMNFLVPGRMNIITLLQEMSWQARCAILLRNDEFTLRYLAEEPVEDDTITETDVLANSLILDHTDTEDLVTKFIAEWRPICNLEDPYKVILRYNVKRYGLQEETFDFYTYNIRELVIKSATFWLIRMANTWRKIICKTPVSKLVLETLDGVFVTLDDIASEQIKCRVETASYNSEDKTIDFVLQTPVRSGENTAFLFHYPAGISVEDFYPTLQDFQFGQVNSGPNLNVTPPEGHVLGQSRQISANVSIETDTCAEGVTKPTGISDCREDNGDDQPSDIDDTKPTIGIEDDPEVPPKDQSPVDEQSTDLKEFNAFQFQQNATNSSLREQIEKNTQSGTGGTGGAGNNGGVGSNPDGERTLTDKEKMKQTFDDLPEGDDLEGLCTFSVKVGYINVTAVFIKQGSICSLGPNPEDKVPCNAPGKGCACAEAGRSGCFVGNLLVSNFEEFHFGDVKSRDAFFINILQVIGSQATVGKSHPVSASKLQNANLGCAPIAVTEGAGQVIGYDQTDSNGKSTEGTGAPTVIGQDGFMMDGGFQGSECN